MPIPTDATLHGNLSKVWENGKTDLSLYTKGRNIKKDGDDEVKKYYLISKQDSFLRVFGKECDVISFVNSAKKLNLNWSYSIDNDQKEGTWE